jgi:hypothetical protein
MSQGQTDAVNQETNIAVVIQTITDSISKEIEQLSRLYAMRGPERVLAFYAENRFLFDLLIEAPTQIKKLFGQDTPLELHLSQEPDFPSSRELFVLIMTKLPSEEAFPLLQRLDEEWWLDNCDKADCKLNFNLRRI